jgi:two-component system sensor histidine kinase KdpD
MVWTQQRAALDMKPDARCDAVLPTPEQRLENPTEQEKRAIFKLFLGYAPGVGKTYNMLAEAIRRRSRGEDVVIGVVESHGRKAISDLASKLEVVPRRKLAYKGRLYDEMDLDAILLRRPRVTLVDELAHTNVEGSKHAKRYDDVIELLDANIDVLSTLNVQHIGSLAPLVQRITGVQIRELVPDRILGRVTEIVLTDVTLEALRNRMRRGDIYPLDRAESALGHFFRPANLIALRELTLRQVARTLGRSLQSFLDRETASQTSRVRERIAVCIKPHPSAQYLIARAFRLAQASDAELFVVYVDAGGDDSPARQRALEESLRLAENLGAQILLAKGKHVADELGKIMEENHITEVVFGHSMQASWRRYLYLSPIHSFLRNCLPVDVHIVTCSM